MPLPSVVNAWLPPKNCLHGITTSVAATASVLQSENRRGCCRARRSMRGRAWVCLFRHADGGQHPTPDDNPPRLGLHLAVDALGQFALPLPSWFLFPKVMNGTRAYMYIGGTTQRIGCESFGGEAMISFMVVVPFRFENLQQQASRLLLAVASQCLRTAAATSRIGRTQRSAACVLTWPPGASMRLSSIVDAWYTSRGSFHGAITSVAATVQVLQVEQLAKLLQGPQVNPRPSLRLHVLAHHGVQHPTRDGNSQSLRLPLGVDPDDGARLLLPS